MKKKRKNKIAPSILTGDFAHLADMVRRVEQSGADYLHLDVMDGHFVDNLTFGPLVVAAANRSTDMFLDVHLMMYNPYDYIERFVEAGADSITFHIEATEDVEETLLYIRRCNVRAGLAYCPETPFSMIPKYLDKCDMMLLMTVHPGKGGQKFMPEVLEKIRLTRESCDKLGIDLDIEVDGGIEPETAKLCADAGANVFVSGSYVFKSPDLSITVNNLRKAVGI